MNIGIDLGTTNTCVSIYKNNKLISVPFHNGSYLLPSIVYYKTQSMYTVGTNPKNYPYKVKHIKRIIGKMYFELDITDNTLPNYLVEKDGKPYIKILNRLLSPETVSSHILLAAKKRTEEYMQENINKVVLTVPAYFNNFQRTSTKMAGKLASLDIIRIINEPTAAALCYYIDQKKNENIIVYDLGGGTLDVSLLEMEDDVIDVVATSGDSYLGGVDIDMLIYNHICKKLKLSDKEQSIEQKNFIFDYSEKIKKELQTKVLSRIKINNRPVFLLRKNLNKYISEFLHERLIKPVQMVLSDSKKSHTDINSIIFIGGSTRVSHIKDIICKLFPISNYYDKINPDITVAHGAGVQAHMLSSCVSLVLQEHLLIDVTSFSFGVMGNNNDMIRIINRNETIPISRTKTFTTTRDNQDKIDIKVYQGEDYYVSNCIFLGEFYLDGLPKARKYGVSIDITFNLNNDGILEIVAKESSTGFVSKLKINI